MNDERERFLKIMRELINLDMGWDGYDAKPVDISNVVIANEILLKIDGLDVLNLPPAQFIPVANGGLQIEWHDKNKTIELYIKSNDNDKE